MFENDTIAWKHSCEVVSFEVFTVVTMKNAVCWNVAPYRSCVKRRFGGTYCHLLTLVPRSQIFLH
jgi:hypothetical protein